MSTPRWTLGPSRWLIRDDLAVCRLALRITADEAATTAADDLAQLIVNLLNATELSDAAIAHLGVTVIKERNTALEELAQMETAPPNLPLVDEAIKVTREQIGTLDNLAHTLNYAKAVYVLLGDEPSIPLTRISTD